MNNSVKRIYLELPEVATLLTLCVATVQRMVREKEFPPPRLLSGRRVGWLVREVEEWAEGRPVSDLPPPPNTGNRKGIKRAPAAQDAGQAG